jgi:nucleotide-binding universal stress UspA family protein
MKKILVPIDGSKYSFMAIDKAREIANLYGSKIVILYVKEIRTANYATNPYSFSPDLISKISKENTILATRVLEDAKSRLTDISDRIETVVLEGYVAEEIKEYAENNDIDLVIIGSSGMSGLQGILGSVARRVVLNTNKDIMVVKN